MREALKDAEFENGEVADFELGDCLVVIALRTNSCGVNSASTMVI